jgi:uncharacterized protein YoxC
VKIAYPLKQDATDPRVVLDANLSVICTFLEGEHAEEMVETMNGHEDIKRKADDLDSAEETMEDINDAISDISSAMHELEGAVAGMKSILGHYSHSHN